MSPVVETVMASTVEPPGELLTFRGFRRILNSNPERQSAASASFGIWEIGYLAGGGGKGPTYRWYGAPSDEVVVRREVVTP